MEELKERVRILELKFAVYRGAFLVATIAILGWLGVTNWVSVPRQVNSRLSARIGGEIDQKISEIEKEYEKIKNEKDGAAKALGIPEINTELASKVSINKAYLIQSGQGPFWIGVNAKDPSWGGAITLGDERNLHTAGLYWHFVEK